MLCLAQQFGDSSCNGHLSHPVTTRVPSPLINTRVNIVTPRSPRSGHRDLPDGLLYGLQPRPAVGEEVEHGLQPRAEGWPLSGTYEVSSPACACASSSCLGSLFILGCPVPRHSTAASGLVCTSQAWRQNPSFWAVPHGHGPAGQTLLSQPLTSQGCQSVSHLLIPTTQPLLTCPLRSSCLNLIWI